MNRALTWDLNLSLSQLRSPGNEKPNTCLFNLQANKLNLPVAQDFFLQSTRFAQNRR